MEGKLKAVIIGATGAIGHLLINSLLSSKKWSKILIITRRKIDVWDTLPMTDCEIKFAIVKSLDILNESKEYLIESNPDFNLEGYSTVFNCLGSRVGNGEEEFRKVDYTYVLNSALLCEKFNIPHFSHVSSAGTSSKSCLLYLRVKGELEEKLKTVNVPKISVFKPGPLLNRKDERCGEKILKVIIYITCCLISHIEATEMADAMAYEAEKVSAYEGKHIKYYSNSECKDLFKDKMKQKKSN